MNGVSFFPSMSFLTAPARFAVASLWIAALSPLLPMQDARAQVNDPIVVPSQLGFEGQPPTYLPDGRFHAYIWATVPTVAHHLRVDDLIWTDAGLEIRVVAERTDFHSPIILPANPTVNLPISLENLPPGNFRITLGETELEVTVPGRPSFARPAPVRIWPEEPTELDNLWLLFDPADVCSEYELQLTQVLPDHGTALVQVRGRETGCPASDAPPRLKAVELGSFPAGAHQLRLEFQERVRSAAPPSGPRGRYSVLMDLTIAQALPSRLGGAWYDPEQPGHGVMLEFFEEDRVLLYWYAFDNNGQPAWIEAQGSSEGNRISLQAQVVSGGAFPPNMDLGLISRQAWGQIELEFDSCEQGSMTWSSGLPGFGSGQMPLHRLTGRHGHGCGTAPPDSLLQPNWYAEQVWFARFPFDE